ncbi:MAG: outer membrane protein transport protein [Rhizobiaceae bacterium]
MKVFGSSILTIAATSLLATAAQASGFGTEGINPGGALFNDKTLVMQGAFSYALPERNYINAANTGFGHATLTSANTNAANSFFLMSGDIKFAVNDELDCAFRAHKPFQNDTTADSNWIGATYGLSTVISSLAFDGTCSYKFDVGDGYRMRLIGGVTSTDLEITRSSVIDLGTAMVTPGANSGDINTYAIEGQRVLGYRLGAAFEIPEYALRAQIIYDSERSISLSGSQTINGKVVAPANVSLTLPKSIAARVQTGINNTTLVYGGFRWTEWSVIQSLSVTGGTPVSVPTGYNDGWDVEVGFQKKLTKDLSGSASVSWAKGIGGGYNDTWGLSAGIAYDLDDNWRVSLGASAKYLTASTGEGGSLGGAVVTYDQADDWAYAVGVRLQYAID